ncbi:MAG: isoprenylcysteine carboxylmethyltransferase family protein [bacterium]|nr:isoprenylcysteine carboxylmethyltransferase family protein [bacterium]
MRESMRKLIQAALAWSVVCLVLGFVWAPALRMPQLWALVGISVFANILQPAYSFFEGQRVPEDRWTARQIVWTVYLSQIAALSELALRQRASLPIDWVFGASLLAMVSGLVLRTWAVRTLRDYFTWNVEVQAGQHIIQTGPYRFVRHPSYTGALLMFVGGCVLLNSWIAAAFAAVGLTAAFVRRIRHEERLLNSTFPEYAEYASRTGSLWPRLF